MGLHSLTATGVNRGVGDISTQYKNKVSTVDVKFDTSSNVVSAKWAAKHSSSTKSAFSVDIPDKNWSGKMDLEYLHNHAAVNSIFGVNPTPHLEISAALGDKNYTLGGEIGFNSVSVTKYSAGITITRADMGQTVKASYIHNVSRSTRTAVAAEMIHKLSSLNNSFTIGSSHDIDIFTTIKTRFSDNCKIGLVCQHEWSPRSRITLSAEYDSKATNALPKLGFALALKP